MSIEIETYEQYEDIITGNKHVIIDFHINGCKPCVQFAPIYEQFANKYTSVKFIRVDAYKLDGIEIASIYNINKFPSFTILENGNPICDTIVGPRADILITKLEALTSDDF